MNNNYDELRANINEAQSGEPKMRALRLACSAAETNGDIYNAVDFHYRLIEESVFSGDRYQALIDFPQYLSLLERDEDVRNEFFRGTMFVYKWVVEALNEFYQIPKEQVLKWFEQYKTQCLVNGCSLKAYWQKKAIFDSRISRAKLRLDYINSLECRTDEYTEGKACDLDDIVMWELYLGRYEKALKAADELFTKRYRSNEVPSKTYMNLLKYNIQTGNKEETHKYARLLKPLCLGDRFKLEQTGILLEYLSIYNIQEGLEFYNIQYRLRERSRNPYLCFWFDRGAAMLFYEAFKTGIGDYKDAGDAAAANCINTAAKFDERNESSWFTDKCCFTPR